MTRSQRAALRNQTFDFQSESEKLFDHVHNGVSDMVSLNHEMKVIRTDDKVTCYYVRVDTPLRCGQLELLISAGIGSMYITKDKARNLIQYQSPKHGPFTYTFDVATSSWQNPEDNHFLIEVLTRDLIYYCKGLPAF